MYSFKKNERRHRKRERKRSDITNVEGIKRLRYAHNKRDRQTDRKGLR